MPWVSVSPDHAVHVTYGAAAPGGGTNAQVAQYYVQSTDQGATWIAPFQLSSTVFTAGGYMGDYQANSVGGNAGGTGVIEALWTDTSSGEDRWGASAPSCKAPPPLPSPAPLHRHPHPHRHHHAHRHPHQLRQHQLRDQPGQGAVSCPAPPT